MMTVCADLFRDVLHYYIQPAELITEIRGIFRNLKTIMNNEQWTLLESYMPMGGNAIPLITKDLSLLHILIRFTCNIPPPQTGWGCCPENDDKSLAGCLERIRIIGKTILDHLEESKETLETDFKDILENLRQNISGIQEMVFKKDTYALAVDGFFSLDITPSEGHILDFKKLKSKNSYKSYFPYIRILICFT